MEVNEEVINTPNLANSSPYEKGWFVVIAPDNLEEDLKDLVQGAKEIQEWLESEYKDYAEKGLLAE